VELKIGTVNMATKAETLMTKIKNEVRAGSEIEWLVCQNVLENKYIRKTGLIWSKAERANTFWVVPDNETQAVRVIKLSSGEIQEWK
jgi:hypothetical protein